jgi:hypothetical protein
VNGISPLFSLPPNPLIVSPPLPCLQRFFFLEDNILFPRFFLVTLSPWPVAFIYKLHPQLPQFTFFLIKIHDLMIMGLARVDQSFVV